MSSTELLVKDLEEFKAPAWIIEKAKKDEYHDFKSPHTFNMQILLRDARKAGLAKIVQNTIDGKYDATKEESDEWAKSPEGLEAFRMLVNGE